MIPGTDPDLDSSYLPQDARRGRRVHQEVYALKHLRHTNVLVMYDVIHTREHIHIITERMEKDLFEYIHRRHGISEGETFIILWQIMAGVMYCHSRGAC
jgi:serine/threonine protein kinase